MTYAGWGEVWAKLTATLDDVACARTGGETFVTVSVSEQCKKRRPHVWHVSSSAMLLIAHFTVLCMQNLCRYVAQVLTSVCPF